ncbi:uncharacterized protein B0H18DRAFT_1038119, partial [Fomitopsis serialis]|uniref:uncharacterized protein n=1 Tax=Fomitopsis serialis TaxID=139415 RepID=UPI0020073150
VEHEWKQHINTSRSRGYRLPFPLLHVTERPIDSWMSARLSKGHSSSGRVLDHGPDGDTGMSESEDGASVSTIPLEDQSTTSDSNDYRQTTMVIRARKAPLCRVREAWWCSNDGHNASDDSPSPTSNSSVSTSSSFSSECSSCLSSEEPFDGKSRNVRCVREEPRRHWLSPLYKRRKGSEAAYGVSSPYMDRSFRELEVEGAQF